MFRKMRRDKQLLSLEQTIEILERNTSGVLALLGDQDYPYAVPLSYVYEGGKLYFHSAKEGHKIDAVKKYEKASFCVIDQDQILPEEFTTHYRSVIAFGKVRILKETDEIHQAMTLLAMKYSSDFKERIPCLIDSYLNNMAVIEMTIDHMTAKASA